MERALTYFQHGRGYSNLCEVHLIFESAGFDVKRALGDNHLGVFAVKRREEVNNRIARRSAYQRQLAVHAVALVGGGNFHFFKHGRHHKRLAQIGEHAFGNIDFFKAVAAEEQLFGNRYFVFA